MSLQAWSMRRFHVDHANKEMLHQLSSALIQLSIYPSSPLPRSIQWSTIIMASFVWQDLGHSHQECILSVFSVAIKN